MYLPGVFTRLLEHPPINGDVQNDAPPRAGSLTKKPIKALRSAPLTSFFLHGIHGGLWENGGLMGVNGI